MTDQCAGNENPKISNATTETKLVTQPHIVPVMKQKNQRQLSSLREKACDSLKEYINQINVQLSKHHNHFNYGFIFFKNTQGLDRRINYSLALALIEKISQAAGDKETYALLSNHAIEETRQQVIRDHKIKPGYFAATSIHSKTLNDIIRRIKSDIGSYLVAYKLSMSSSIKSYRFDTTNI